MLVLLQIVTMSLKNPGRFKDLLVAAGEQEDIRYFFLFSKVNVLSAEVRLFALGA